MGLVAWIRTWDEGARSRGPHVFLDATPVRFRERGLPVPRISCRLHCRARGRHVVLDHQWQHVALALGLAARSFTLRANGGAHRTSRMDGDYCCREALARRPVSR